MSIDFNDLRLVRKYGSWINVLGEFHDYVVFQDDDKFQTPESAWAMFLKEEDEDGEA